LVPPNIFALLAGIGVATPIVGTDVGTPIVGIVVGGTLELMIPVAAVGGTAIK
jgi:hypothetical protein